VYDFVNDADNQGNFTWEKTSQEVAVAGIDDWADGWPLCAEQNALRMTMTLTRRKSSNALTGIVSEEAVRTLWLCDNGSYTDVTTIAVETWLPASFSAGCIGGGNVAVAAGQTEKHVTYTYDRVQCISSDQWNAYGDLIEVDLPDPDRWNCDQNRIQNPLP
jgi:hypothetical protein